MFRYSGHGLTSVSPVKSDIRVGFAPFAPFATLALFALFALFAPPLDTGKSVQVHLPYCLIGIEQEEPLDQTPTPLGSHLPLGVKCQRGLT